VAGYPNPGPSPNSSFSDSSSLPSLVAAFDAGAQVTFRPVTVDQENNRWFQYNGVDPEHIYEIDRIDRDSNGNITFLNANDLAAMKSLPNITYRNPVTSDDYSVSRSVGFSPDIFYKYFSNISVSPSLTK
jgi:hypothetical protein